MHLVWCSSEPTLDEETSSRGWPGLGEEVADICMKIGIPDVNRVVVSKEDIKDTIYNHPYSDTKQEFDKSKKLNDIKHKDFQRCRSILM